MHHSRLGGLIIDCRAEDLQTAAEFWSQALGYSASPADDPSTSKYVGLETPPGEPYIELQRVEHPSRVHLDIKTDDLEAEVQRLEKLGATRIDSPPPTVDSLDRRTGSRAARKIFEV